ncbi:MAG TPA: small basic protein [Tepidisphaeraceae bacterium]|jgi:small basic protein (TIGR04137 family)|nr:small basic protein [Tepidisphaeraceae bacterium]
MSLDRSLKSASSLVRHRNVLSRAERLDILKDAEKWDESKPVYGLPKVGHRKQTVGKAVKKEAEGDEAAAPAKGGKGGKAAPAAAAAPAAGAKGAAAAPAKKGK